MIIRAKNAWVILTVAMLDILLEYCVAGKLVELFQGSGTTFALYIFLDNAP